MKKKKSIGRIVFGVFNILLGLIFIPFIYFLAIEISKMVGQLVDTYSLMLTGTLAEPKGVWGTFKDIWGWLTLGFGVGILYIWAGISILAKKIYPKTARFLFFSAYILIVALFTIKERMNINFYLFFLLPISILVIADIIYLTRPKVNE